ncbi:CBS domain-containing protein [Halocatena salina]|uniref:CBS domain-containing protein n=1 Tax=Halocatena salina TaxID=2934340 RepID=A0A8U0A741_9EURY|nr:CBS domain-containing protein [Halocatena salina]UPM43717.1 CBS domain-containing protein [Halocatena salina]
MVTHDTVRDVLVPDFVGASESDSVPASARLLLEERTDHLVVLRGTDPVGLVSTHDLLGRFLTGDAADATLGDVMTTDYETITPDVSVEAAADRFIGSSKPLLVVENGKLMGLLTERDLLTAPQGDPYEQALPIDESTDNTDADAASQGICEDCGAFTRSLTVTDGRSLCSDCLDV